MIAPFAADLPLFFDPTVFGIAATYTPRVGSAVTVNGIFDDAYAEAFADIEGLAPRFVAVQSNLPSAGHGDTLTIASVNYLVVNVRPDGQGLVTLHLQAQ